MTTLREIYAERLFALFEDMRTYDLATWEKVIEAIRAVDAETAGKLEQLFYDLYQDYRAE